MGELLGPTTQGSRTDLSPVGDRLSKDEAYKFRLLAEHGEEVEWLLTADTPGVPGTGLVPEPGAWSAR
jgi:hypothetical protein